jgi:hypothetical protein
VTGKIFRCSTNGHSATRENLQTDLTPSSFQRLEVDTTVDEGLGEITPTSLECVDTKSERAGGIGSVEELEGLIDAEQLEQFLGQIRCVAVVLADIGNELFDQVRARSEGSQSINMRK